MVVAYLVLGFLAGLVAGTVALIWSQSVWIALGCFILAGNAGLLASAAIAYLARSRSEARRTARTSARSSLPWRRNAQPSSEEHGWSPTRR